MAVELSFEAAADVGAGATALDAIYRSIQSREAEYEESARLLQQANADMAELKSRQAAAEEKQRELLAERNKLIREKHAETNCCATVPARQTAPPLRWPMPNPPTVPQNVEQQWRAMHSTCDKVQDVLRRALGQPSQHASQTAARLMALQSRRRTLETTRAKLLAQREEHKKVAVRVTSLQNQHAELRRNLGLQENM